MIIGLQKNRKLNFQVTVVKAEPNGVDAITCACNPFEGSENTRR